MCDNNINLNKNQKSAVIKDESLNIEELTPLFQQYYGFKRDYPDCVVLMRCGDFYEAYGEDAEVFARDAELTLTSKEAGGGQRLAMAGVPYHAADIYIRSLIEKGHRLAIAEQMELPSAAKGLVRREVTRVVTKGTAMDPLLLDEKSGNFLACLAAGNDQLGMAIADVSTGQFLTTAFARSQERLAEELARFQPSEIVLAGSISKDLELTATINAQSAMPVAFPTAISFADAEALLKKTYNLGTLRGLGFQEAPQAAVAAASLLEYLRTTSLHYQVKLARPQAFHASDYMIIDATTRRNLELTETMTAHDRRHSLLGTIDKTNTAMGARLLRDWMLRPLISKTEIAERHSVCAAFLENSEACSSLRSALKRVMDIERLVGRITYGSANARDLLALAQSLNNLPDVIAAVEKFSPTRNLQNIQNRLDPHLELSELLENSIAPEAPLLLREGGIIKDGYNAELDELRFLRRDGKNWVAGLEERERKATGIRNLKVGYTSVFGYYIELSKANIAMAPAHYVRKQTLTNSERYIIPELKEYEAKILGAEEQIRKLEYDLFVDIRSKAAEYADSLRQVAQAVAELDVYASFANMAQEHEWVRPELVDDNLIDVQDSRHPVVEEACCGEFVPNDCRLDSDKYVIILTGPNMSGKSTWLRQVAQLVLLNQMGSFIPARMARLGIVDRIFTRVGASDDLHLGQSTFMVEMSETANIVNNATCRSLVILDEIGRGTSTFDGLAIAQSVLEYLHDKVRCLTLFATHFHELTRLERRLKGCRNCRVAVRDLPDEVVFLHKIVAGGADRSYGIYVARLAGMPSAVLERAEALLRRLENSSKRRQDREAQEQSNLAQTELFE
ncbi:MAG: DNA mismatch repair protein MutS [bacterium]|nr:DNA mismatch repair protein MutS [bacterium]